MKPLPAATDAAAVLAALALSALPAAAQSCRATSAATPPAIVELYTSEGCSSCPPADRWASQLKGRDGVLVLAFHVNYWDRLGWPDRFATAAITERQHRLQRTSGAPYVYTPQVMHNGRDLRSWRGAALPALPPSAVTVALTREGTSAVHANVDAPAGQALTGYWAVLEDGHESRVKAGENAGETLKHDHVVTHYEPLAAWSGGPRTFALALPASTRPQARRVALVVTDARGATPLQAAVLGGC
jgi:hypothetical protein